MDVTLSDTAICDILLFEGTNANFPAKQHIVHQLSGKGKAAGDAKCIGIGFSLETAG